MAHRGIPVKYLNTDMDIESTVDIRPLVRALGRHGVYALYDADHRNRRWRVTLEADVEPWPRTPMGHIRPILKAVESLPPKARAIWDACKLRQLDIGYECGDRPRYFNQLLPHFALRRMAALGLQLRITLYADELREAAAAT